MGISNQIAVRLFQKFVVEIQTEIIALAHILNHQYDKNLIKGLYRIDFTKLNPRKKITNKQSKELLVLYSYCWMTHEAELTLVENKDIGTHALMGTILFYAYLFDYETQISEKESKVYSEKITKILDDYQESDFIPKLMLLTELSITSEVKAGFSIIQALDCFMDFEIFS